MKTAIYLAARYSRRLELLGYAGELEARGYRVVSTWIDGHHETRPGIDDDATDAERAVWAMEDLNDLRGADWLIAFTEGPRPGGRNRGGRHVETGYFLARQEEHPWMRLVVIGPRETVFHCLPFVRQFDTWADFLASDAGGGAGRLAR